MHNLYHLNQEIIIKVEVKIDIQEEMLIASLVMLKCLIRDKYLFNKDR
jgi:hypothetical protein